MPHIVYTPPHMHPGTLVHFLPPSPGHSTAGSVFCSALSKRERKKKETGKDEQEPVNPIHRRGDSSDTHHRSSFNSPSWRTKVRFYCMVLKGCACAFAFAKTHESHSYSRFYSNSNSHSYSHSLPHSRSRSQSRSQPS